MRAFVFLSAVLMVAAHPTMYKLNDKKLLEADLVPVSSTVIPLPIYQVSSGVNVGHHDKKFMKPVGPIPLIVSGNQKKFVEGEKPTVKEVSKKQFRS